MGLPIGDNFDYKGRKMLDNRMSFKTKEEMANFPEHYLPQTFFAVCDEDSQLYVYSATNVDDGFTGKWRIYEAPLTQQSIPFLESVDEPRDRYKIWIPTSIVDNPDQQATVEDIIASLQYLNAKMDALYEVLIAVQGDVGYIKANGGGVGGGSSSTDVEGALWLDENTILILDDNSYLGIS